VLEVDVNSRRPTSSQERSGLSSPIKQKGEPTDGDMEPEVLTPPTELKNCTAPYDKVCIIEAYYDRGW